MLRVMTFAEIFQPGLRHWREQQESDRLKILIVPAPGPGPIHVDLDAGVIELRDGLGLVAESSGYDPSGPPGEVALELLISQAREGQFEGEDGLGEPSQGPRSADEDGDSP
jgi:hypothetical protein